MSNRFEAQANLSVSRQPSPQGEVNETMGPTPEVIPVFSVPVISGSWSDSGDFNRELEALVLKTMENEGGMVRSNVGGWHSPDSFLERDVPVLNTLRKRIHSLTDEATRAIEGGAGNSHTSPWSLYGWANVNPRDSSNKTHIHPDAIWSGVYYVRTVSNTREGAIVFEDTNRVPAPLNNGVAFAREHRVVPRNGQMLLFPSTVRHRVEPHADDIPRISIAFNLKHPEWALNEIAWIGWTPFIWTHFPALAQKASRIKQGLRRLKPGRTRS